MFGTVRILKSTKFNVIEAMYRDTSGHERLNFKTLSHEQRKVTYLG